MRGEAELAERMSELQQREKDGETLDEQQLAKLDSLGDVLAKLEEQAAVVRAGEAEVAHFLLAVGVQRRALNTQEAEFADATCECCSFHTGPIDCSLYNELIFDAKVLTPEYFLDHIQAVVFPADTSHGHGVEHSLEYYARQVERTLKHKGVHVPLVRYDAFSVHEPRYPALKLVEQ